MWSMEFMSAGSASTAVLPRADFVPPQVEEHLIMHINFYLFHSLASNSKSHRIFSLERTLQLFESNISQRVSRKRLKRR